MMVLLCRMMFLNNYSQHRKDIIGLMLTWNQRKKAIVGLADILENVCEGAKNLFNSEFNIPKNDHDKIIFSVVNGYNIHHDNQQQKTDYSKDIWYDWMMQYYTNTVIVFYRVKEANENSIF